MKFPKPQLLAIVLLLIFVSIWYLEDRKAGSGGESTGDTSISVGESMTAEEKEKMYQSGHEISTPDGFINTDGVTVADEIEKGNIVLIDFWTYSCINCQRTLPYLRAWHEKYADQGLTIIGVHTPEFDFEKDIENVQRAVDEFEVPYPVVLDNDFSTWRSYQNRFWPRKYLIDIDGFIVYDRIGEGGYEATEEAIVKALEERAERLGLDTDIESGAVVGEVDEVDRNQPRTPEIYFGHERLEAMVGFPSQECLGLPCMYGLLADPPLNKFSLSGLWNIGQEKATFEGESGAVILHFVANKVNIVAEGDNRPINVEVLLDGEPIGDEAGADVQNGVVTVDKAGLYNLVDLGREYNEHILEIRVNEPGLSAFTFTFG